MYNTLYRLYLSIKNKVYNLTTHFGNRYSLSVYSEDFFDSNQEEGLSMTVWSVPLFQEVFKFKSLMDVGCATGHYLKTCIDAGITDVLGLEGSPEAMKKLMVDKKYVVMHDFRDPYTFDRKWDLAISIEVAEHIDGIYSDNYVKILTDSSDTVLITAAPPGQGGTAHVNEQPQEWWIAKFKTFGFVYDKESTDKVKNGIAEAEKKGLGVAPWLAPNLMVFRKI